jgi:hypothetical protein
MVLFRHLFSPGESASMQSCQDGSFQSAWENCWEIFVESTIQETTPDLPVAGASFGTTVLEEEEWDVSLLALVAYASKPISIRRSPFWASLPTCRYETEAFQVEVHLFKQRLT